jgi:ribose 1,5-bisphosphokinase PhnN
MVGYAMRGLFQAEAEYARESALVLLTAEDDVLSARLAERGITPITREVLAERRAFAESMKAAGWPSVNTGRSVDVVAADLYAWAKERLG